MEYITDFERLFSQLDYKPDPDRLVSRNSSENTIKLFEYLKSIYGNKFLSGQQYLQPNELEDVVYYRLTGKLPAVRGYDFMGVSTCRKPDDQVERAIKWATECGGIVTMCWHWYAPDDMNDYSKGSAFYYKTTNYDNKTSFDILRAVEYGTAEYEFIIREIDGVAAQLKRMADLDIPVLWRPLHEANGDWFWWGDHGGEKYIEAYKKLWYIMFDRMENYHKLNNLIWVWNGQDKRMQVNPNTYDIYGDDVYSEKPNDHSSLRGRFEYAQEYNHGKLTALSECGYIPHPDEMKKDNVKWLWWLPWWGGFVYKREEWRPIIKDGFPVINDERMSEEFLKEVFAHEDVVSLQELTWWDDKKYKIPDMLTENLKGIKEPIWKK
ncbi:MAG: beta-mannanase [Eubacterium sp.]|nr:beta-mannanase [Eubacterium sp.]